MKPPRCCSLNKTEESKIFPKTHTKTSLLSPYTPFHCHNDRMIMHCIQIKTCLPLIIVQVCLSVTIKCKTQSRHLMALSVLYNNGNLAFL